MVRRGGRSSSPRSSSPVRSAAPKRSAASPTRPAATSQPAGAAAAAPPSKGSGLMGQMAATAGGVAIGSAMGHALGNMFSGGGSQEATAPADNATGYENQKLQQQYSQPCEFEWRQFLECSQSQSDVSVCQAYNDLFKECKTRNGAN